MEMDAAITIHRNSFEFTISFRVNLSVLGTRFIIHSWYDARCQTWTCVALNPCRNLVHEMRASPEQVVLRKIFREEGTATSLVTFSKALADEPPFHGRVLGAMKEPAHPATMLDIPLICLANRCCWRPQASASPGYLQCQEEILSKVSPDEVLVAILGNACHEDRAGKRGELHGHLSNIPIPAAATPDEKPFGMQRKAQEKTIVFKRGSLDLRQQAE